MRKEAEGEHKSHRNESLQNITTNDLPDSASQTAQPQDSKFSFRSHKHSYTHIHRSTNIYLFKRFCNLIYVPKYIAVQFNYLLHIEDWNLIWGYVHCMCPCLLSCSIAGWYSCQWWKPWSTDLLVMQKILTMAKLNVTYCSMYTSCPCLVYWTTDCWKAWYDEIRHWTRFVCQFVVVWLTPTTWSLLFSKCRKNLFSIHFPKFRCTGCPKPWTIILQFWLFYPHTQTQWQEGIHLRTRNVIPFMGFGFSGWVANNYNLYVRLSFIISLSHQSAN